MKKQLLNESEVRAFMKFANIEPLAETFIDKLNEAEEATPIVEQEEMPEDEESDEMAKEPIEMDMEEPAEMDMEEPAEMDMGAEDEAGEGDEDAAIAGVKMVIQGLKDTLSAAGREDLSGLFDVQDDAAPELEPMGDEEPLGVSMEEPAEEELEEGAYGDVEDGMEEELVNEVARRVASRLASMSRG